MDKCILDDVKKIVGIHECDENFERDILMHTNTALFILKQEGIGKDDFIAEKYSVWSDFLYPEQQNVSAIKTWVGLKVKMIFDPPASNVLKESIEKTLDELEYRIYSTENYIIK